MACQHCHWTNSVIGLLLIIQQEKSSKNMKTTNALKFKPLVTELCCWKSRKLRKQTPLQPSSYKVNPTILDQPTYFRPTHL